MKFFFVANLFLATLLTLSASTPQNISNKIAKRWLMIGMEVNGKKYGKEWLDRQRQNGIASVLQFQKNGSCQVHIYTKSRGGNSQKKTTNNRWEVSSDDTKLLIKSEKEPPQSFTIISLSGKKMVLALEDQNGKQVFSYKSIKGE